MFAVSIATSTLLQYLDLRLWAIEVVFFGCGTTLFIVLMLHRAEKYEEEHAAVGTTRKRALASATSAHVK